MTLCILYKSFTTEFLAGPPLFFSLSEQDLAMSSLEFVILLIQLPEQLRFNLPSLPAPPPNSLLIYLKLSSNLPASAS